MDAKEAPTSEELTIGMMLDLAMVNSNTLRLALKEGQMNGMPATELSVAGPYMQPANEPDPVAKLFAYWVQEFKKRFNIEAIVSADKMTLMIPHGLELVKGEVLAVQRDAETASQMRRAVTASDIKLAQRLAAGGASLATTAEQPEATTTTDDRRLESKTMTKRILPQYKSEEYQRLDASERGAIKEITNHHAALTDEQVAKIAQYNEMVDARMLPDGTQKATAALTEAQEEQLNKQFRHGLH